MKITFNSDFLDWCEDHLEGANYENYDREYWLEVFINDPEIYEIKKQEYKEYCIQKIKERVANAYKKNNGIN